ncbi:hypothetical protein QBC44DRAFT_365812 [Cladorrhinum sp. PSN332]|nr:hypothetical protein QBC44DRAFT_365812 [Cladorrhinum sp. PSN332]
MDSTKITSWIASKSKPLTAAAETAAHLTTDTTKTATTGVPLILNALNTALPETHLRSRASSWNLPARPLPNPLSSLASAASLYLPTAPSAESLTNLGGDVLQAISPEPSHREKEFRTLSGHEDTARGVADVDDILSLDDDESGGDEDDVMAGFQKRNYGVAVLSEHETEEERAYAARHEKIDGLMDEMDDWFQPIMNSARYRLAMKETGCGGGRLESNE